MALQASQQFFSAGASSYLSLIHISEPTRLGMISYAVFCLKKTPKKCGFYGFVATSPQLKKLLGSLECHCVTPPLLSPGVVGPLSPLFSYATDCISLTSYIGRNK